MVSSKYKQLYECRLPAQAVRFHQDPASEPESQGYTGPDIPDILSPMHDAQCLVKVSFLLITTTYTFESLVLLTSKFSIS